MQTSLTRLNHSGRPATVGWLSLAVAVAVALAALLAPATASAQPVQNPKLLEFDPSADHAATLSDGSPAVSRYDFELYMAGAVAPFHTVNIGKPTPGTDGKVRVDFSSQVVAWPLPGGTYESRVAAVGPGGTGRSAVSNQFQFCSYSLASSALSFGVTGSSSTTVVLAATSGCTWTAASSAPWVTLSTSGGTGNGSVTFSVASNTGTTNRTATIWVGDQALMIAQAGITCDFTLGSATLSAPAAASTNNSVGVTTAAGCTWAATSSATWLTLTTGSGTGSGSVVFSAAANTATSTRTGTISVGGKSVTVTQAAATCTYTLAPTGFALAAAASSGNSVGVTTLAGCTWAASSSASWLTLATGSGTGSGSLVFAAAANAGPSSRSATVSVGSQSVTVTQAAGVNCTYNVSPLSVVATATAGSASLTVTPSNAACGWTATPAAAWLSVDPASAAGPATVSVTWAASSSRNQREGTVTIAGQTVSVSQAGKPVTAPGALRVVKVK
jgi:hypothetical protein